MTKQVVDSTGMPVTQESHDALVQSVGRLTGEIELLGAENGRMRRWIGDAMSGNVTESMKRRAAGDRLAVEPTAPPKCEPL